jgi:hypothetical protein
MNNETTDEKDPEVPSKYYDRMPKLKAWGWKWKKKTINVVHMETSWNLYCKFK